MARPRLIVFARFPAIGAGARRLARDVGDVEAWRLTRAMTSRVLRRVRDPRWETVLAVTPDAAIGAEAPGVWPAIVRLAQGKGDLGDRMERALSGPGPAVLIGSDVPHASAADIADAFRALRRSRFVFGPSEDGGYWLIGAKRGLGPGALSGVRWSSEHALADTQKALNAEHAPRVRTLRDVDDGADWKAVRAAARL